jgi:hypothetical protein
MKWTAIVVNDEGVFSHSFSFVGSHSQSVAFEGAQEQTARLVVAIIPGEHPVYHPSMDE